tara:strand:- start:2755 stop:4266 length:1512 start_codon:yes stop_codon:yes gene_type:complete
MQNNIVQIKNLSKSFPGTLANDNINLDIKKNTVHALLGENGAGKSTLVKILYGILGYDKGEIFFENSKFNIKSPSEARKLGIGMVFQHFSLFDSLTVAENLILGLEEKISLNKLKDKVSNVSSKYELPIDLNSPITSLSAGEKQRVEIIRILLQNPKMLIMDEPTSVLTPQEVQKLFITLNKLINEGTTILYITHKLEEVIKICNRVTIMRNGKIIETCDAKNEDTKSLATKMLGKKLPEIKRFQKPNMNQNIAFKVNNLTKKYNDPFLIDLQNISFEVNEGEIFGIAGIAGNGQSELMSHLTGEEISKNDTTIQLYKKNIGNYGPLKRRNLSIAFVPEDRLGHSAVPQLSLIDNVLLSQYGGNNFSNWGVINKNIILQQTENIIKSFNVVTPSSENYAGSLSGGNLQKFVIGREILTKPKVLIISHPTWGIDAGAELSIRQTLIDLSKNGTSIIVISQDIDELIEITDRLSVIYKGKLSESMNTSNISIEKLGLLMGGKFDK